MLQDKFSKQAAQHAGLTLEPGQRVFDSKSREFGTVMAGSVTLMNRPNKNSAIFLGPDAVTKVPPMELVENWAVELDDGTIVRRDRDELVPFSLNAVNAATDR
jgi:hypothetical protein